MGSRAAQSLVQVLTVCRLAERAVSAPRSPFFHIDNAPVWCAVPTWDVEVSCLHAWQRHIVACLQERKYGKRGQQSPPQLEAGLGQPGSPGLDPADEPGVTPVPGSPAIDELPDTLLDAQPSMPVAPDMRRLHDFYDDCPQKGAGPTADSRAHFKLLDRRRSWQEQGWDTPLQGPGLLRGA